jgi:hypothetical protein
MMAYRCRPHNKLVGDGPGLRCYDRACQEEASKAAQVEPSLKLITNNQPKPAVERPTAKVRKVAVSGVINPSSVINPTAARKRGRPIKSNDTAHQQARERARRYRERKAAAQTGTVASR